MRRIKFCGDGLERRRCLREIKTIREIVGGGVREAEREQFKIGLDELEQAAEIVGDVNSIFRSAVRAANLGPRRFQIGRDPSSEPAGGSRRGSGWSAQCRRR